MEVRTEGTETNSGIGKRRDKAHVGLECCWVWSPAWPQRLKAWLHCPLLWNRSNCTYYLRMLWKWAKAVCRRPRAGQEVESTDHGSLRDNMKSLPNQEDYIIKHQKCCWLMDEQDLAPAKSFLHRDKIQALELRTETRQTYSDSCVIFHFGCSRPRKQLTKAAKKKKDQAHRWTLWGLFLLFSPP